MKEECIFCKKNHLKLNSSFEEFIFKSKLEYGEIMFFMGLLEKELTANHWNEVFCMITTVSNMNKIPQNTLETIFLITMRNIQNCIIYEPKMTTIQKYIKNLTTQIEKMLCEQNLRVKNTENANSFDEEIDRFNKIFVTLKEKSPIDSSLKNYIVYRLMTFFEYKSYDVIEQAIDGTNDNKTTYGKLVLGNGQGILKDLNQLVILILQNVISSQKDSTVKLNVETDGKDIPKAKFFQLLNEVIEITSPDLKKYFDDNYNGDWYALIDQLKTRRNSMVHEMSDAEYDVAELESITDLMKIFFYAFPHILLFMMNIIPNMRRDEEIEIDIGTLDKTLNTIKAKIVSIDYFYDALQKKFDLDYIHKEFEKNKQAGVFLGWNKIKNTFGFIKRDENENLYVHKSDVTGSIKEGDKVEYLVGVGRTGKPVATNLRGVV